MKTAKPTNLPSSKQRQRGAALLIAMLIVVLGLVTLLTFRSDRKGPELEAERKTALVLAQAKEALLGYAARDENRPGSLPCADINDDGLTIGAGIDLSCSADVIARLPWGQLGLQDLRDGGGERLWYAISPSYRAFLSGALNTTNRGSITIRNAAGAIVNDASASPSTGVVAVIIAPGGILTRQGTGLIQDRSCAGGGGCTLELTCLEPYQTVAKCNPANYLDVVASVEDNANFISTPPSASTNGFIYGAVRDAAGVILVNDRMITIRAEEIFTVVTQRMIREFVKKLEENDLVNPYPLSLPAMPRRSSPPPPAAKTPDPWVDSDWNDAVESYVPDPPDVNPTQFTLKFKNCASVFTVIRNGTGNVISRMGNC